MSYVAHVHLPSLLEIWHAKLLPKDLEGVQAVC